MSKITIITGGTSGIGRGIAEKILENSASDDILYVSYGHNTEQNPCPAVGRVSMTPLYNPAFACKAVCFCRPLCSTDFLLPPPGAPVPVSRIWS